MIRISQVPNVSQNGWLTCMKLVQMCSNTQSAIIGGREQRIGARVHHEEMRTRDHTRRSRGTNQQIFFIAEAWTWAHWPLGRTFTRHQPGPGLELPLIFLPAKIWSLFKLYTEIFADPSSIIQTMRCVSSECSAVCSAQALHKNPLQIIMSPCWGFAKHTSINHRMRGLVPGARCGQEVTNSHNWQRAGRRKSSESVQIFSRHHSFQPFRTLVLNFMKCTYKEIGFED